jgi:hypothetical protein
VIGGKKRVSERIGKRTIASYLTDKITVIECVDVFGRRGFGFVLCFKIPQFPTSLFFSKILLFF